MCNIIHIPAQFHKEMYHHVVLKDYCNYIARSKIFTTMQIPTTKILRCKYNGYNYKYIIIC